MAEEKPFGLARNYPAEMPIGQAVREHRAWAAPGMARLDRIEVDDRNADGAGFVAIWAMGEPLAEDVPALDEIFGGLGRG